MWNIFNLEINEQRRERESTPVFKAGSNRIILSNSHPIFFRIFEFVVFWLNSKQNKTVLVDTRDSGEM